MSREPFAYFFDIGTGPPFFRLASDPSVPHLLANPDVYHATPLVSMESDEVRREWDIESAKLQGEALSILQRVTRVGSPYDLAEEAAELEGAIDSVLAPEGSPQAVLLFLRDRVNWAVWGEDGFNVDDYRDTLARLEDLARPIPLETDL